MDIRSLLFYLSIYVHIGVAGMGMGWLYHIGYQADMCLFFFFKLTSLIMLQVDRLIGKDHLFKRSIILIKAWCYYESRILGAHHGLISTYALETLVLYIFHLFHSSLDGPLAVSSKGILAV